ncbi:MAG: peptidoglycan endopeptidase [Verrucomicrobia bacterium]|nr:peptidoglycan endopeptidase [Verrucomicrobiota bacterium]
MTFHRFCILILAIFLSHCSSKPNRWEYQNVRGKTAVIVNGKAVPPAGLPKKVMQAISAGNEIVGKPYKYGGGHASFNDTGYDCSATVSYALHGAGLIDSVGTSGSLRKYGKSGAGKYITVYAKSGHTFIVIAGLRLDTGYNGENEGPKWSTRSRPIKGYVLRHPSGL